MKIYYKLIFLLLLSIHVLSSHSKVSGHADIIESSKTGFLHQIRLKFQFIRGIRQAISKLGKVSFVKVLCPICAKALRSLDPVQSASSHNLETKDTSDHHPSPSTSNDITPPVHDSSTTDSTEEVGGVFYPPPDDEDIAANYNIPAPQVLEMDEALELLATKTSAKPPPKPEYKFFGGRKVNGLVYTALSVVLLASSFNLLSMFFTKKDELVKKIQALKESSPVVASSPTEEEIDTTPTKYTGKVICIH
jgi:hypothetical protein